MLSNERFEIRRSEMNNQLDQLKTNGQITETQLRKILDEDLLLEIMH